MKWLQWSNIDLIQGLGGVETHARCLARELRKMGITVELSQNPDAPFQDDWDVIQTHGGSFFPRTGFPRRAVRVHTLHGLTLERMWACRELLWPGGYYAALKEIIGLASADVVLSVHPELSLFSWLTKWKTHVEVCSNGWDSWEDSQVSDRDFEKQLKIDKPFWVYVGRGHDVVKGADRVVALMAQRTDINLVAVPGEGFEKEVRALKTGILRPQEVRQVIEGAQGLLLTSRYEGLPLVVLEALAQGVPVVCTSVGGLKALPTELEGIFLAGAQPAHLSQAMAAASALAKDSRKRRALTNRKYLKTWRQVAQMSLNAVEKFRQERGMA